MNKILQRILERFKRTKKQVETLIKITMEKLSNITVYKASFAVIVSLCLVFVLTFAFAISSYFPQSESTAAAVLAPSGRITNTITWTFNSASQELVISGSGNMPAWNNISTNPSDSNNINSSTECNLPWKVSGINVYPKYITIQGTSKNEPIVFPSDSSSLFAGNISESDESKLVSRIIFKNVDTSNVTNMNAMFKNNKSLKYIDLACFDTSSVTNIDEMFYQCSSLLYVDVSNFDTSSVTGEAMNVFFGDLNIVTLDLFKWNDISMTGTVSGGDTVSFAASNISSTNTEHISLPILRKNKFYGYTHLNSSLNVYAFDKNGTQVKGLGSALANFPVKFDDSTTDPNTRVLVASSLAASNNTQYNYLDKDTMKLYYKYTGNDNVYNLKTTQFETATETHYTENSQTKAFITSDNIAVVSKPMTVSLKAAFGTAIDNVKKVGFSLQPVVQTETTDGYASSVNAIGTLFTNMPLLQTIDFSNLIVRDVPASLDAIDMYSGSENITRIILPEIMNSSAVIPLPNDAEDSYVWEAYDSKGKKVNNGLTYTNLFARTDTISEVRRKDIHILYSDGTNSKVYFTNRVTVNGVKDPSITVTEFDISSLGDESMMAYLFSDGMIIFEGEGENIKYTDYAYAPWLNPIYRDNITKAAFSQYVRPDGDAGFKPTYLAGFFRGMTNLEKVDTLNLDTSNCTNMEYMFSGCSSLLSLDTTNFATANVLNMHGMFKDCSGLNLINTSTFNTQNVTDFGSMFDNCQNLTSLNVTGFDTSNALDLSNMFNNCKNLTVIDVSGFDTSSALNMHAMFNKCEKVLELDTDSFVTTNVIDMGYLFNECLALSDIDVTSFDTSKVIDMQRMFGNTYASIDGCEDFNTSKVQIMKRMFYKAQGITELDLSNWDTRYVADFTEMFAGCKNLEELNLYNTSKLGTVTEHSYSNDISTQVPTLCYSSNVDASGVKLDNYARNISSGHADYEKLVQMNPAPATYVELTYGLDVFDSLKIYDGNDNLILTLNGACDNDKTTIGFTVYNSKVKFRLESDDKVGGYGYYAKCYKVSSPCTSQNQSIYSFFVNPYANTDNLISGCINLNKFVCPRSFSLYNKMKLGQGMYDVNVSPIKRYINVLRSDLPVSRTLELTRNCMLYEDSDGNKYYPDRIDKPNNSLLSDTVYEIDISEDSDNSAVCYYYPAKKLLILEGEGNCVSIDTRAGSTNAQDAELCVISNAGFKPTSMEQLLSLLENLKEFDGTGIDTSNCTSMRGMFSGCIALEKANVSMFDTSKVSMYKEMFNECSSLTDVDVSNFKSTNVPDTVDISYMFAYNSSLTEIDLGDLINEKVAGMDALFYMCDNLTDIKFGNVDAQGLIGMNMVFAGCQSLEELDLSKFVITRTNLGYTGTFGYMPKLKTLNISNMKFGTYAGDMFKIPSSPFPENNNLKEIILPAGVPTSPAIALPSGGLDWKGDDGNTYTSLAAKSGTLTKVKRKQNLLYIDNEGLNTEKRYYRDGSVTDKNGTAISSITLNTINLSYYSTHNNATAYSFSDGMLILDGEGELNPNFGTKTEYKNAKTNAIKGVTSIDGFMPDTCYQLFRDAKNMTSVDLSTFDISNVKSTAYMFRDCSSLTSIDTTSLRGPSLVTDTFGMFDGCSNLTTLDLTGFDMHSVKNMKMLFSDCKKLTKVIGLEDLDTSSAEDMSYLFYNCFAFLDVDLSSWNTSNVKDMSSMFYKNTSRTSIDVSMWDTHNVQDMNYMFSALREKYVDIKLVNEDGIHYFDTSACEDFECMFGEQVGSSKILNLDLSKFDTHNAKNMRCMFIDCIFDSIDVSSFDTSNVVDMSYMFSGCDNLTSLDLSNFDTSKVRNFNGMFNDLSNLTHLDLYDENQASKIGTINEYVATDIDYSNVTIDHSDNVNDDMTYDDSVELNIQGDYKDITITSMPSGYTGLYVELYFTAESYDYDYFLAAYPAGATCKKDNADESYTGALLWNDNYYDFNKFSFVIPSNSFRLYFDEFYDYTDSYYYMKIYPCKYEQKSVDYYNFHLASNCACQDLFTDLTNENLTIDMPRSKGYYVEAPFYNIMEDTSNGNAFYKVLDDSLSKTNLTTLSANAKLRTVGNEDYYTNEVYRNGNKITSYIYKTDLFGSNDQNKISLPQHGLTLYRYESSDSYDMLIYGGYGISEPWTGKNSVVNINDFKTIVMSMHGFKPTNLDYLFNGNDIETIDFTYADFSDVTSSISSFGTKVDTIILPDSVPANSAYDITLPQQQGYAWHAFDKDGNRVSARKYTKLTARTDEIYMLKKEEDFFYIDDTGVKYFEEDIVYRFDVSKEQDQSVMAYYFRDSNNPSKYHGGTMILRGEKDNVSENIVMPFNTFIYPEPEFDVAIGMDDHASFYAENLGNLMLEDDLLDDPKDLLHNDTSFYRNYTYDGDTYTFSPWSYMSVLYDLGYNDEPIYNFYIDGEIMIDPVESTNFPGNYFADNILAGLTNLSSTLKVTGLNFDNLPNTFCSTNYLCAYAGYNAKGDITINFDNNYDFHLPLKPNSYRGCFDMVGNNANKVTINIGEEFINGTDETNLYQMFANIARNAKELNITLGDGFVIREGDFPERMFSNNLRSNPNRGGTLDLRYLNITNLTDYMGIDIQGFDRIYVPNKIEGSCDITNIFTSNIGFSKFDDDGNFLGYGFVISGEEIPTRENGVSYIERRRDIFLPYLYNLYQEEMAKDPSLRDNNKLNLAFTLFICMSANNYIYNDNGNTLLVQNQKIKEYVNNPSELMGDMIYLTEFNYQEMAEKLYAYIYEQSNKTSFDLSTQDSTDIAYCYELFNDYLDEIIDMKVSHKDPNIISDTVNYLDQISLTISNFTTDLLDDLVVLIDKTKKDLGIASKEFNEYISFYELDSSNNVVPTLDIPLVTSDDDYYYIQGTYNEANKIIMKISLPDELIGKDYPIGYDVSVNNKDAAFVIVQTPSPVDLSASEYILAREVYSSMNDNVTCEVIDNDMYLWFMISTNNYKPGDNVTVKIKLPKLKYDSYDIVMDKNNPSNPLAYVNDAFTFIADGCGVHEYIARYKNIGHMIYNSLTGNNKLIEVAKINLSTNSNVSYDDIDDAEYDSGNAITIADNKIKVYYTNNNGDKITLTKDYDYTVSYSDNTNAGTAKVVITGINNVTGTLEIPFKINRTFDLTSLNAHTTSLASKEYDKTKKAYFNIAGSNTDTFTYTDSNTPVGFLPSNVQIKVTGEYDSDSVGIGKTVNYTYSLYSSTLTDLSMFKLENGLASSNNGVITERIIPVTVDTASLNKTYDGTNTSKVKVTCDSNPSKILSGDIVTLPTEFTGTYARTSASQSSDDKILITLDNASTYRNLNNANYKLAEIDLTNLKGLINKKNINDSSITFDDINAKEINNTAVSDSEIVLTDTQITPNYVLVKDTDYEVSFGTNNIVGTNKGQVNVTAKSNGNYTGSRTKYFNITKANASTSFTATCSINQITYKASNFAPSDFKNYVTIKDGANTLVCGTDYDLAFPQGVSYKNVSDSKITLLANAKGNYTGSITVCEIEIIPYTVKLSEVILPSDTTGKNYIAYKNGTRNSDSDKTKIEAGKLKPYFMLNTEKVTFSYTDAYITDAGKNPVFIGDTESNKAYKNIFMQGITMDSSFNTNYNFLDDIDGNGSKLFTSSSYLVDKVEPYIEDIKVLDKDVFGLGEEVKIVATFSEELQSFDKANMKLYFKIGNNNAQRIATIDNDGDITLSTDGSRKTIVTFRCTPSDLPANTELTGIKNLELKVFNVQTSDIKDGAGNGLDIGLTGSRISLNNLSTVKFNTKGFTISVVRNYNTTSGELTYTITLPTGSNFGIKETSDYIKSKFNVSVKNNETSNITNYDLSLSNPNITITEDLPKEKYTIKLNTLGLGLIGKDDIKGCDITFKIDSDSLTNNLNNKNIEAKDTFTLIRKLDKTNLKITYDGADVTYNTSDGKLYIGGKELLLFNNEFVVITASDTINGLQGKLWALEQGSLDSIIYPSGTKNYGVYNSDLIIKVAEIIDNYAHSPIWNITVKNKKLSDVVKEINDIIKDTRTNDNTKVSNLTDALNLTKSSKRMNMELIDPSNTITGNLLDALNNYLPNNTLSKELLRRCKEEKLQIGEDNILDAIIDILNDLIDKDKFSKDLIDDNFTDTENAMIAYQKLPEWTKELIKDDTKVINLFNDYYGDGNTISGIIDGYETTKDISNNNDNEIFEVFGVTTKLEKDPSIKVMLDVEKISDDASIKKIDKELRDNNKLTVPNERVLVPYEINLLEIRDDDTITKIQPKDGSKVLVKIKLPYEYFSSIINIYHTEYYDDTYTQLKKITPLDVTCSLYGSNYYVYFETDSFSPFTITCNMPSAIISEEGETNDNGTYKGGTTSPNGLYCLANLSTKGINVRLNSGYKAEVYQDGRLMDTFKQSNTFTIRNINQMLSNGTNTYITIKYIKMTQDEMNENNNKIDIGRATITIQVADHNSYIDGYKDKTFKPNNNVTRAEFSKMLSILSNNYQISNREDNIKKANNYNDVNKEDWYSSYVGYLSSKNIMKGYTNNTFKPNGYLTRAEACKVLSDMYGIKTNTNNLTKVNTYQKELEGKWYKDACTKLISNNLINGYPDGTFKPNDYISRAEIVSLINRVLDRNITKNIQDGYKNMLKQKLIDVEQNRWYYKDVVEASISHASFDMHN